MFKSIPRAAVFYDYTVTEVRTMEFKMNSYLDMQ